MPLRHNNTTQSAERKMWTVDGLATVPGHCLFVLQVSLWRHMMLMMMMIIVIHGEANLQRLMLHEN